MRCRSIDGGLLLNGHLNGDSRLFERCSNGRDTVGFFRLTQSTLNRGGARGRVCPGYKPGATLARLRKWMKPDQSAAPEASSSLGEAPRSSTPIPTSAAGASSSTHTPRSGAYLEPDWPAFFGGRKFLNGSRQADPQQVRTFYKEASRIFNDNAGNFDAHLTNNAAASSAFLRLLRSESVSNRALVDQIAGPCPLPNGAVASDHSRKAMA